MITKAKNAKVPIIDLHSYETARAKISNLVLNKIEEITDEYT